MTATGHNATGVRTRRVLAFTGVFLPGYKAGGPIKSVVEILDNLSDSVKVTLVTSDRDLDDTAAYVGLSGRVIHRGAHEVYYVNWRKPGHWIALLRWARRNPVELIYVNSLWSPVFTILPIALYRLGLLKAREALIAPRGELSPGALGIKQTKKRVFLLAWAPLLRGIDPVWHASTEMEEREIHEVFPWARTVIQIDSLGNEPRGDIIRSEARARFTFISRLSEKKNLRLVLQALEFVTSEVDFDIYGPVEDKTYWKSCRRLMDKLPNNVRATYCGALRPDQIQTTFARYDGFIFPTLGENFGHVIAESLSAGCPVICSEHTPWTNVLNHGGGAALTALNAKLWADEINQRASQTTHQRDHAKKVTLGAFTEWRKGIDDRLAIEIVLDDPPFGHHGQSSIPYVPSTASVYVHD